MPVFRVTTINGLLPIHSTIHGLQLEYMCLHDALALNFESDLWHGLLSPLAQAASIGRLIINRILRWLAKPAAQSRSLKRGLVYAIACGHHAVGKDSQPQHAHALSGTCGQLQQLADANLKPSVQRLCRERSLMLLIPNKPSDSTPNRGDRSSVSHARRC